MKKITLFFTMTMALNIASFAQLSGNYTIDSSLPLGSGNYQSFADATADLDTSGVSGAVTFTVAPGIYNEQVIINEITGASSTHTITFDGVDSSVVKVLATSTAIATVILDSADHIVLKNMTIQNTGTANAAVLLGPDAHHNNISNSILKVPTTGSNTSIPLTFSGLITATTTNFQNPSNSSYNVVENNRILNGHYGIWINAANSANANTANQFLNNDIDSIRNTNIYAFYQDSLVVSGNRIDAATVNTFAAVYFNNNTNSIFSENYINASSFGLVAQSTTNLDVINNMLISAGQGIYFISSSDVNLYHNSVQGTGSQTAVDIGSSGGHDVRNNIFNGGSANAFKTGGDTSVFTQWDNNIYHTTGASLVQVDNVVYADLTSLQNTFPVFNVSSLEGDPNFESSTDLHIQYGGFLPNGKGDNSVGVSIDYDNQQRPLPGSTTVDIGADEFNPPTLNASVVSLVNPSGQLCSGTLSPIVSIGNLGIDTINSVDIIYSFNGIADTIAYTGQILPGTNQNVTLNQFTFNSGIPYNFVAYTTHPNNNLDDVPADDTLSLTLQAGLAGTYTIDASAPVSATNYQSFTAAINDLEAYGICSSVTFNIASGTYNESVSIGEISGVDASNTITFNGNSTPSVNMVGTSSSDGTFILDGADYITIKNMSIRNTGTANSAIILESGSHYNTISNTFLRVPQANVSTSTSSIVLSIKSDASHNTIEDNRILHGQYGLKITGTSSAPNVGNQILNNSVDSVYAYSVHVDFQDSLQMIGNNILSLGTAASNFVFGAYLSNSVNTVFSKNNIASKTYGVLFQNFSIPSASTRERKYEISNNMIVSTGYYGVWMQGVDSVDLFHNSISVEGSVGALTIDASSNDIGDYDVRNNIFDGGSDLAIDADRPDTIFTSLDYNIYYTTGTELFDINNVSYADLASYQSASPSFNASSLEVDPQFAGQFNLHMITPVANNIGDNSVGISDDIDNDPRPLGTDTVVDIGADEYRITALDLEIANLNSPVPSQSKCFTASENVAVSLTNIGQDSLNFSVDNATITVNVTGMITQTLTYTINNNNLNNGNSLSPTATDSIEVPMGTIDMTVPGTYYFEILANVLADSNISNNSYYDSVIVAEPYGGVITGFDTICFGDSVTLTVGSFIGDSLQWQFYDVRSFVDITGATGTEFTVAPSNSMEYRVVTCGYSNLPSDTFSLEVVSVSSPTTIDDTVIVTCGNTGEVNLRASSTNPNASFVWYDAIIGGNKINNSTTYRLSNNGDSLTYDGFPLNANTPQIDTFYVEEVTGSNGKHDTLTVEPYTGGSSCNGGNMFDVVGKINLSINGFLVNSYTSGWQTIDVYVKSGSYLNSISSTANWTLVESVNVFGNGTGNPSELHLSNPIFIDDGDTMGIYIDYDANYTSIPMGTTYSNNDMNVIVGHGFCTPINLNPKPGNAFNGEVLYATGCVGPRSMAIGRVDCLVGDEELTHELSSISITPNPTKGYLNLSGINIQDEVEVVVFNSNGKVVYQLDSKLTHSFNKQINLSNLVKGIYFVKLQGQKSMRMKKVIIQ